MDGMDEGNGTQLDGRGKGGKGGGIGATALEIEDSSGGPWMGLGWAWLGCSRNRRTVQLGKRRRGGMEEREDEKRRWENGNGARRAQEEGIGSASASLIGRRGRGAPATTGGHGHPLTARFPPPRWTVPSIPPPLGAPHVTLCCHLREAIDCATP
ncbi:hypothetical protein S40285_10645 [Stachybotrys chlorohalonatus IBT 40285]|uniref:Uncharacterized protein n=1 Tax=Stachybotrys chlorohalonatus (strain IBT 40285) TaxID=1283841 RepID=A0A084QDS1_STAC4|nr:hypothetical protein S40285_10645 [Stachybotrys chlorohalonata IBT 40285]